MDGYTGSLKITFACLKHSFDALIWWNSFMRNKCVWIDVDKIQKV